MAVSVDYVQAGGYTAQQARMGNTAMLVKSGPLTARAGIVPSDGTDFAVTAVGTPNTTVNVAPGQLVIPGAAGGAYLCTLDATQNTDILTAHPADPTNPRIDLVIFRVYDNEAGDAAPTTTLAMPGSTAGNATVQTYTGKVEIVNGTPGAIPAVPSLPNTRCVILKQVTIPALAPTILTAYLADTGRIAFTAAAGGIVQTRNSTERAALIQLGYLGDATGPVGTTDCGSSGTDLVSVSVPVIAGRRYRVTGFCNGSQQTTGGNITSSSIVDDQSGSRLIAYNPTLAVGAILLATGVHWFTATTTRTAVLKVRGFAAVGAYRVGANGASILVEDMGT